MDKVISTLIEKAQVGFSVYTRNKKKFHFFPVMVSDCYNIAGRKDILGSLANFSSTALCVRCREHLQILSLEYELFQDLLIPKTAEVVKGTELFKYASTI